MSTMPSTTEAAEDVARKEMPNSHIFIGNLTYQTRESELKDFVEKFAGKTYHTFRSNNIQCVPCRMMSKSKSIGLC